MDNSVGSKARVVALYVGPTAPQRSFARKDSNATYIEGETLKAALALDDYQAEKTYNVKPAALTKVDTAV